MQTQRLQKSMNTSRNIKPQNLERRALTRNATYQVGNKTLNPLFVLTPVLG